MNENVTVNYDVLSRSTDMLYFSYTRSASGYTKAVFQSIFPRFFVVNAQFVYEEMYLTLNSDIGSLLVRIDRVALKRE